MTAKKEDMLLAAIDKLIDHCERLEGKCLAHRHILSHLIRRAGAITKLDEYASLMDRVEMEGGDISRASAYRAEIDAMIEQAAASED